MQPMTPGPSCRPRARERRAGPLGAFSRPARGGISWVTALLLALLLGGGYLAWTWGPVWLLHYMVKQVVHDYMNQAVKNRNDQTLLENMIHKLRTLDTMEVPGDQGELVEVPTVQIEAGDVTWERDLSADPPVIHVAFAYTRPVKYPLLERWTDTTLSLDLTGDLTVPDWGPSR